MYQQILPNVYHKFAQFIKSHELNFTKEALADDIRPPRMLSRTDAEAISEDLILKSRKDRGLPGAVTHPFCSSTFIMPMGQSVVTTVGYSPNHDH
ncbi:hypothetical protein K449DRAFT_433792 [Hypoxylon sp. EC38]|nr:hypothetical protein K449DRAFT_433792 [Hypoxylon sp. EC38]